jgi:hypothetical protein
MYSKLAILSALAVLATAAPSNPVLQMMKRQSGEVVTGGAATTSVNDQDGSAAPVDQYIYYTGDGSDGAGWPDRSKWSSYEDLWNANVPLMQQSCGWNGWGANDSADEISAINTAIEAVAAATSLDHRFILAVMIQESAGCVRVPTTNNGVVNPGLMQDHNGSGSCLDTNPCPQSEITQMITDGVAGTSEGPGLAGLINQAQSDINDSSARAFYAAARLYNSGSADYSNLDNGITSTPCYASDVANRLTGWTLAASNCQA